MFSFTEDRYGGTEFAELVPQSKKLDTSPKAAQGKPGSAAEAGGHRLQDSGSSCWLQPAVPILASSFDLAAWYNFNPYLNASDVCV